MRIPRFWVAAEGSAVGPQGQMLFRRVWGWSMTSAAEALDVAHERLRSALERLVPGTRVGGYYPRTPLREPILDELIVDGEQVVVITRNRYGAEVLNTDRVLIADIDLPYLRDPGVGLFRRLFRRQAEPSPPPEPRAVRERLATVGDWARANPGLSVAVYRTASGLRVFVAGDPSRGDQVLAELDADPIYRELCRAHGTFRARLTPKPWRLPDIKAPQGSWPDAADDDFQRWLTGYEAAGRNYAVCRLLEVFGPTPSTMDEQILRLHDERTGVHRALPLA